MKLTKDPLFRLTFIIGMVVSIGSAIAIGFWGIKDLGFCVRPECFSNFLTYYAFPFKTLTVTAAIIGIVAMMHKSKQTATQIDIAAKQNMYLNYFSHLKDFKEQINSLELKALKPINNYRLYKCIFVDNTPYNFKPSGTLDNILYELQQSAERVAESNRKFHTRNNKLRQLQLLEKNEIITNEDAYNIFNCHDNLYCHLNTLLYSLGFQNTNEHKVILTEDLIPNENPINIISGSIKLPPYDSYDSIQKDIPVILHKCVEISFDYEPVEEFTNLMLEVHLLASQLEILNKTLRQWANQVKKIESTHLDLIENM